MIPSASSEILSDARAVLEQFAWPQPLGEGVKAMLRRVSFAVGIPFRRVRGIWYGEARSVTADEWLILQAAAARLREDRIALLTAEIMRLKNEQGKYDGRAARLADLATATSGQQRAVDGSPIERSGDIGFDSDSRFAWCPA